MSLKRSRGDPGTFASREHRGCFGKSSGGYGAIIHGMKYAKYWGAIADHSGDAYFDFVYWHDWPNTLNELAKHRLPKRKPGRYDAHKESRRKGLAAGKDDGRIRRFLNKVWHKEKLSTAEGHAIMNICMAATYDPDPRAPLGFRIPFNAETGELIPARWRNWRRHDPIHLVSKYRANLLGADRRDRGAGRGAGPLPLRAGARSRKGGEAQEIRHPAPELAR